VNVEFFDQKDVLEQTRVVRSPRRRLSTFGSSEIQYSLVTADAGSSEAILRQGRVAAERPKILTPGVFSQRFQDFGPEGESFERFLRERFGEAFRGLEYVFRNHVDLTEPRTVDPRELARNIQRDLDARDVARAAVICGPEKGWPLCLMKFILEETSQSFTSNVRELEERGLFDPAQTSLNRRRREIEDLFHAAAADGRRVPDLAACLKRHGVFEEYQDRFFRLVKN
jgi:hypothetical protein